ncbi:uncharacterized protein LOC123268216 [Cotesia glomerata]|uniref:uncharacterized protein LOC123268216 n=1 Tax=Cotesia glomerata TaxID=32391 RepID=UPI001D002D6D|nr:uncharacterized protein LOC123268216 [Cotesia glomerata]
MKTIKIKNFSMKLWVVLSILAVVHSYDNDWDGAEGQYEREVYDDDIPIILTLPEIVPVLQVKVFYKNHHLYVTQREMPRENPRLDPSDEKPDLQIVVPDTEPVFLNPSDINDKDIYIHHSKEHIFVFQGEVPKVQPEPPLISTADDSILYLNAISFIPEKLIKIYYDGDRLFVSQRDVPDNKYFNEKPTRSFLQYIGSDRAIVYLYPTKINWDQDVAVQHSPHSISVFQGRKPRSYLREDNAGETKYLPDSFQDYDATFDGGEVYSMFSDDFNPRKTALIFFDNGKMRVTQKGAPEETNPDLAPNQNNLQTMTSDENKLVFHPARFSPEKQIKVQHLGKRIFVWIGRYRAPSFNVNNPEIIEVIRPKVDPDYDTTVDSGEVFTVYSDEFNLDKSVRIFVKNGQLKVTQVNTPEETNPTLLPGVKSLQTITSDENSLLFYPARFSPDVKIRILYKSNKIFFWTGGSQPPRFNTNRPEIIEVIEPETEDLAPEETPFDTSFDSGETVELFPTEFDLTKLVYIFFQDGQLKVTQIGAPEEPRRNTRSKYRNLKIISSDVNKLMLYPARILQDQEINLRHENGEIFLWQGFDKLPIRNVNRPDIVKVIKPPRPETKELEAPKEPKDLYVISGKTLIISPETFNVNKLIYAVFKNNKLQITQDNAPEELDFIVEENLPIVKSDTAPLMFHPNLLDIHAKVYIRHQNCMIYIWQGSEDLPVDISDVEYDEKPVNVVPKIKENLSVIIANKPIKEDINVTLIKTEDNSPAIIAKKPIKESINLTLTKTEDNSSKIIAKPVEGINLTSIETEDNSRILDVDSIIKYVNYKFNESNTSETNKTVNSSDIFITKVVEINSIMNISLAQFNPRKLVSVSFKNDTWIINQLNTPKETLNSSKSTKLQIIKPSTETIFLHTAFIDPSEVHLRYDNGKIYIWQGDSQPLVNIETDVVSVPELAKPKTEHKPAKPVIVNITYPFVQDTSEFELPKAENVSLHFKKPKVTFNQTIQSGRTLSLASGEFDPHKLVMVSYINNSLEVTQVRCPKETWDERIEYKKSLQIIRSDTDVMYLHAGLANLESNINFRHENGKIYIWQGAKPEINEDSPILNVIDPNPRENKSENDFDATYESSYTVKEFSKRFNLGKLLSVTVENNKLHLSQVNMPEDSVSATGEYKNLQVVKSESVRVLVHLARVNPDLLIHIRHENGRIYIWQGSDQIPKEDVDMLSVVEVIEPSEDDDSDDEDEDEETVVQDLNQSVSDKMTLTLFSNMYNPDKLVVVKHANHQIHVNQIDRVKDDGNENQGYEDLHLSIPNESSATFDPRKIDPNKMIIINYIKKKTQINTAFYKD